MTQHTYTHVAGYAVCNDCGASASQESKVQHYPSCKPGDSAKWREYYSQPDPDEDGTEEAF